MSTKVYLKWEEVDMAWSEVDMLWEEVYILVEVGGLIKRGGGISSYVKGNPWDITKRELGEEKTKKFIKLFCRVNDLDYSEVVEPNSKIKVTVEQMEKVFNEAVKVGVKFDFKN